MVKEKERKQEAKELLKALEVHVASKEAILQAGACQIIFGKDEKGRPTITPLCPADEFGQPVLSEEVKALNDVLRSPEVVLKTPKVIEVKA